VGPPPHPGTVGRIEISDQSVVVTNSIRSPTTDAIYVQNDVDCDFNFL
jgi:hypothetical protein